MVKALSARILIMNDNRDMLLSMKDVLELSGATVRTATSRTEAHKALANGFAPDVLVIDVRLGNGERGDQFARELRADPKWSALAIVLMSGDVHEVRRLRPEVDGVLEKPFDIGRLLDLVSDVCSKDSAGAHRSASR